MYIAFHSFLEPSSPGTAYLHHCVRPASSASSRQG